MILMGESVLALILTDMTPILEDSTRVNQVSYIIFVSFIVMYCLYVIFSIKIIHTWGPPTHFSCFFFFKTIEKKSDLMPKVIFVVLQIPQSSFLILQKHTGSKVGDKKSKNK